MAQSRIFHSIAQALLVLLFLAWLPAAENAYSENSLPFQVEEVFSLSVLPDSSEPYPDGWDDGEGRPDASILSAILGHANSGIYEQRIRQTHPDAVFHTRFLEARRATGPPSLS